MAAARLALEGKRVVVTRARAQAEELCMKLRAVGAVPVEWPLLRVVPPSDDVPLRAAMQQVEQFDWVIFSSANGVKFFFEHDGAREHRPRRVAAVGPATAAALQQHNVAVDAVPDQFLARRIPETLGDICGQHILWLRPESAPPLLGELLRTRGARVDEVTAYRTVLTHAECPLPLAEIDALTLASASAATGAAVYLQNRSIPAHICIACIGPSTASAARAAGLRVDVVAAVHTLDGLIDILTEYFGGTR